MAEVQSARKTVTRPATAPTRAPERKQQTRGEQRKFIQPWLARPGPPFAFSSWAVVASDMSRFCSRCNVPCSTTLPAGSESMPGTSQSELNSKLEARRQARSGKARRMSLGIPVVEKQPVNTEAWSFYPRQAKFEAISESQDAYRAKELPSENLNKPLCRVCQRLPHH